MAQVPNRTCGAFDGHRREGGFTFIEVALTVGLLAMIAGLVLPRVSLTPSLPESGRQLMRAIRSLTTAAAASNQTYRLHLDLDRHVYWATLFTPDGDRVPSDPALAFRTALPSTIRFEDATIGHQGKATVGRVVIEFLPGGRTDRAVIHLTDQIDQRLAMVIHPLTGKIEVSDRYFVEPPKVALPESYRQFFQALPPSPLPIPQAQRPSQS